MKRQYFASRGSITIETALVLPMMLMAMYLMLFPLKVMESERILLNRMEAAAKQMARAEYAKNAGSEMIELNDNAKEITGNIVDGIETGISMVSIFSAQGNDILKDMAFDSTTSILSSDDDNDASMIYIKVNFRPDTMFSMFELLSPAKSLVTNRRAWVGSSGGRGRSKYGEDLIDDEDDENQEASEDDPDRIVYLGQSSVVYHDDPNCHYLSNVMSTADASYIDMLRNESGGKYHACPSCNPGSNGTVYYFKNGTAYHSSENCKAITAYARAVHLSDVEGMRACSYCGKEH